MDKKIDYSKIYLPYKLGMFTQCPKSYHFYYLDPIYSQMKSDLKKHPHNIWSFNTLGKAVHNAITLFYYLPPKQRTEENLLERLKETWVSEVQWNKKPPLGKWGGFEAVEEERDAYTQAILMLKKFLTIAETEPEIEYLPTQDFKKSISDYTDLITPLNKDFDISGKFDLIVKNEDGSLQVIDFKTGKREEEDYFQLRFYKLLAEENFQKPVKKASFYFLKTGNKKQFDLKKEKSKSIKKEILEKIKQIKETASFEPKPSKLCRFCLFKTFCPEKEKIKEITKDLKEEDYSDDLPF
jgi:putative RecB family exonuclease